jgi:spore maturation protein CgeD
MAPLASVFTPSYNKGRYAAEAIASVLGQDCPDFEYWILENSDDGTTRDIIAPLLGDSRVLYQEIDLDPAQRAGCYPPAMLLNRYYPEAAGKYIFYLSDDDLLDSTCIRTCTEFLEAHPARRVCYFSHRHEVCGPGGASPAGEIAATVPLGGGTEQPVVDCRIDGGQIAHRKDCLDYIDQPWFPETPEPGLACHADGRFMQKLAAHFTFHPVPETLGTKRRTPLSAWDRP